MAVGYNKAVFLENMTACRLEGGYAVSEEPSSSVILVTTRNSSELTTQHCKVPGGQRKSRGTSSTNEQLSASNDGLCSVGLIGWLVSH